MSEPSIQTIALPSRTLPLSRHRDRCASAARVGLRDCKGGGACQKRGRPNPESFGCAVTEAYPRPPQVLLFHEGSAPRRAEMDESVTKAPATLKAYCARPAAWLGGHSKI